jgi:hypothetical protein
MVACEGTFGAAVAAKSALELLAHFVTGGGEAKFDPFSDAMRCNYTQLTRKINQEPLYDHLCGVVKLREDADVERVKTLCTDVLKVVLRCEEFRMPVQVGSDEEILVGRFSEEDFKEPRRAVGNWCRVSYQLDYDDWIWPGSGKRVDHTMSWSGVSSVRLTQLGFSEVWAHDSPATVEVGALLNVLGAQLKELEKGTEKQRCCRAIDSLLRTTCVTAHLNNFVAIGAIVRELHLTVERLIVLDGRSTEEENNLDILADDLDYALNDFRKTVHGVLSSFAHPGWLIRTELLQFLFDPSSKEQALFLTAKYTPRKFALVRPVDGSRTSVSVQPLPASMPLRESHWRILGTRYPEAVRESLRLGNDTTQPGEAFTVPFEAFELCRRALEELL